MSVDRRIDRALTQGFLFVLRPQAVYIFFACKADRSTMRMAVSYALRRKLPDILFVLQLLGDPNNADQNVALPVQIGTRTLTPSFDECICAGCTAPLDGNAMRLDLDPAGLGFTISAFYHDRPACATIARKCLVFHARLLGLHYGISD